MSGYADVWEEAAAASERARDLQAAAEEAMMQAARASALAELAETRADCDRWVAQRLAALSVEEATTRAALRLDRLQHGRVAGLEQEVAALQAELAATRQSLSAARARCGELEHALASRAHTASSDRVTRAARTLSAWRRCLAFSDQRELAVTAATCRDLRLEAQSEGLWELLCRKKLGPAQLTGCTNFRAAAVSRAFTALSDAYLDSYMALAEALPPLAEAMPRSVLWTVDLPGKLKKGTYFTSPSFTLGPLTESYILFYPRGDELATSGQCSLYIGMAKGVEVVVDILLNGVHVKTLKHHHGKKRKLEPMGFASLAPAPSPLKVEVVLRFKVVRSYGYTIPFSCHDVYL